MVKSLLSGHFRLLLLIMGLIIYPLVQGGCSRDNLPWQLDFKYSRHLTVMAPEYKDMTGSESADTVDALRVYKVTSKRYQWYSLRELFTKEIVFETKDKSFIKKFILAAQERADVEGCKKVYKNQEYDQFYVVMFDNTFKRAGYFLVTSCKAQDKQYREVSVPDDSGFGPIVYQNESLISILKAIHS